MVWRALLVVASVTAAPGRTRERALDAALTKLDEQLDKQLGDASTAVLPALERTDGFFPHYMVLHRKPAKFQAPLEPTDDCSEVEELVQPSPYHIEVEVIDTTVECKTGQVYRQPNMKLQNYFMLFAPIPYGPTPTLAYSPLYYALREGLVKFPLNVLNRIYHLDGELALEDFYYLWEWATALEGDLGFKFRVSNVLKAFGEAAVWKVKQVVDAALEHSVANDEQADEDSLFFSVNYCSVTTFGAIGISDTALLINSLLLKVLGTARGKHVKMYAGPGWRNINGGRKVVEVPGLAKPDDWTGNGLGAVLLDFPTRLIPEAQVCRTGVRRCDPAKLWDPTKVASKVDWVMDDTLKTEEGVTPEVSTKLIEALVKYNPGNAQWSASNKWLESWMSNVPDETTLNQMTIPGTHDSLAFAFHDEQQDASKNDYLKKGKTHTFTDSSHGVHTALTFTHHGHMSPKGQDPSGAFIAHNLDLKEQMDHGLRWFDLRLFRKDTSKDYHPKHNQLWGSHAGWKMWMHFKNALSKIWTFLDDHESEAIFISIKQEGDKGMTGSQLLVHALEEVRAFAISKNDPTGSRVFMLKEDVPQPGTVGTAAGHAGKIPAPLTSQTQFQKYRGKLVLVFNDWDGGMQEDTGSYISGHSEYKKYTETTKREVSLEKVLRPEEAFLAAVLPQAQPQSPPARA